MFIFSFHQILNTNIKSSDNNITHKIVLSADLKRKMLFYGFIFFIYCENLIPDSTEYQEMSNYIWEYKNRSFKIHKQMSKYHKLSLYLRTSNLNIIFKLV